jgi:ABC-type glycerol-3-phosphate transport system substrate-binding protein
MKKKLLTFILLLALAVSNLYGCSRTDKDDNEVIKKSADATKEEKGRYIEKPVALPELPSTETISMIVRNKDKQFEAYTYDTQKSSYQRYILKTDETWETGEASWLNNKEIQGYVLNTLCIGEDGNIYAVLTIYDDNNICKIYKSEDNGLTSTEIPLTYLTEPAYVSEDDTFYPSIVKMQVLKDGTLVLSDMWKSNTLLLYSQENKALGTVAIDSQINFIASSNTIIAASDNSSQIIFYDAETGKTTKNLDYTFQPNGVAYSLQSDGTLLVGDSLGIHRMLSEGTLWEIPVDGSITSMGMPSLYVQGIYEGDMEPVDYYLSAETEKGLSLIHYVYDKDISAVPQNQVTLYSLRENPTIRQAISLFQQKNPDTRINYVVAMGNEGGNLTDYIRALNTELLAGNGADIILLDGLPAQSYIEKGVLADISDILIPLTEDGSILSNISNPYKKDETIYQMPIRFSIPMIIGTADTLASVSSLDTLINNAEKSGKPYVGSYAPEALVNDFLALYGEDFFKDNKLSESDFEEFLKNLKRLSDNIGSNYKTEYDDYDKTAAPETNLFRNSWDLFPLRDGKTLASCTQIRNIPSTLTLFALAKETGLSYSSINNTFLPSGIIGLNKASKNTETAKAFLKFLFTDEVQSTNLYDGLPVNRASLKKWTDEENEDLLYGLSDAEGNEFTAGWPDKKDRDNLFQIAQEVDRPINMNQQLNDVLKEQILSFLNGDIGLNEAVTAVKSKVNTYLSE